MPVPAYTRGSAILVAIHLMAVAGCGTFIDEDDTMYVLDSESGDERNPGMRRGLYIGNARDGSVQTFIPPHENV